MSVESEIKNRLTTDASVTAVFGTRIYPLVLPQNPTLPGAQYAIIDGTPRENLFAKAGLYRFEIQIDIFANKYSEVVSGEDAIRRSLQSYDNVGTGSIQAIHHIMSMDDFEKEIANYKKVLRFSVWYTRQNP